MLRKSLEQATHGPEPFLRGDGGVGETDELGDACGRHRSNVVTAEGGGDAPLRFCRRVVLGDARDLPDDLEHWPERDAFAVGKTAPGETGRVVADLT